MFLEASVDERAQRRYRELEAADQTVNLDKWRREIEERDERDRRTQARHGPWPSPEAIRIDTTGLTIDGQVARILKLARERGAV